MKLHITLDLDNPRELQLFKDYLTTQVDLTAAAPSQPQQPERVDVGDPRAATLPPEGVGAEPDISLADVRAKVAEAQRVNPAETAALVNRAAKEFEVTSISAMDGSQRATLLHWLGAIINGDKGQAPF